MNAVISGTAGVALLVDGEQLHSIHARQPVTLVPRRAHDFQRLFGEAGNLEFVEDIDEASVRKRLEEVSAVASALNLTLILLDKEMSDDVRRRSARELSAYLAKPDVAEGLEAILYAKPLPASVDCHSALAFCSARSRAKHLLRCLDATQPAVRQVRTAWEAIPDDVFASDIQRAQTENALIQHGVFRELTCAVAERKQLARSRERCIARMQSAGRAHSRTIVDLWIERLRASEHARKLGAIGLLQPSGYFRWKDVPGRLLACLLFVLGLPIMALTIAAVRLTSRGPAIFKQTRVGRNCRVYTMYKIRTMRVDAEAATGPVWTQTNDPRITPVGRLIRRLHLDEFPQLINVLRGEMALIGPRPERPEFTQRLAMALPRYLDRLAVRPGITGLAQVNLPPDTDLDSVGRKLVLDLHYVREAHLGLDLRLLACAIAQILGFRGPSAARFFGVEMAVDLTPYDEGEGLAPRVERAPTRSRTRMRAGENRAQGNRAAVRPSVPSSLSDDALNDLCLDQSDEVEFQLSARQTKSSRARMLVEYQGKIDRLLEHLKRRSA